MIRREPLPRLGPSTCRRCQGSIVWAHTDRGHRMPVDSKPSSAGQWILWHDPDDGQPQVSGSAVFNSGRKTPYGGPLWSSHFATCSNPPPKKSKDSKKSKSRQLDLFGEIGGRR